MPLLTIEPVDCPLLRAYHALWAYPMAIFTSHNAVLYTLQALEGQREFLASLKIAAIGSATAQTLEQHGVRVMFQPQQGFTSEDLLALPAFSALEPLPILLFKGEGGRTVLADTLTQRGMQITPCVVYKRIPLRLNPAIVWAEVDYVLITSVDSLQQLASQLIQFSRTNLLPTLPLLVGSERIAQSAQTLGFRDVTRATDPSDSAMLNALLSHSVRQDHD